MSVLDYIFTCFCALEPVRGRPGTPWRPSWAGDPKNHKKTIPRDPHFGLYFDLFLDTVCDVVFYMRSEPRSTSLFVATGMLLGLILMTLGDKWDL